MPARAWPSSSASTRSSSTAATTRRTPRSPPASHSGGTPRRSWTAERSVWPRRLDRMPPAEPTPARGRPFLGTAPCGGQRLLRRDRAALTERPRERGECGSLPASSGIFFVDGRRIFALKQHRGTRCEPCEESGHKLRRRRRAGGAEQAGGNRQSGHGAPERLPGFTDHAGTVAVRDGPITNSASASPSATKRPSRRVNGCL